MTVKLYRFTPNVLTTQECLLLKSEMHHYQNATDFSLLYPHFGQYIYAPFLFLKHMDIYHKIKSYVPDGFSMVYDQIIEMPPQQKEDKAGFAWHTDFESAKYMKPPIKLQSLWIALVDLNDTTGGRLKISNEKEATTLSQLAHYFAEVILDNPSRPDAITNIKDLHRLLNIYLESNCAPIPTYKAGDGHVFDDLLLHASEPLKKTGYSRQAYVMRFIPENAEFDFDRIKSLRSVSFDNYFYQLLVDHKLSNIKDFNHFIFKNAEAIISDHPDLKSNFNKRHPEDNIDGKFTFI